MSVLRENIFASFGERQNAQSPLVVVEKLAEVVKERVFSKVPSTLFDHCLLMQSDSICSSAVPDGQFACPEHVYSTTMDKER